MSKSFWEMDIACFPPQGALLDQSISDLTAVLKQFHLLKTVLPLLQVVVVQWDSRVLTAAKTP